MPVRPEPLRGLADACLDRRVDYHLCGARIEHHGARALSGGEIVMNSIAGISNAAQSPVPTVLGRSTHAASKMVQKILVRNLNFYYGDIKALKSVYVTLS